MTNNSYEKLRAIFLSVVMVVSVFGATVALSGGAAAVANDLTLDPSEAGDQTVTATALAETAGNDVSFAIDSNGDGSVSDSEQIATVASSPDTGEASTDFVTSDFISDGNGEYTVYAVEGSTFPQDTSSYDDSATLTIEGSVPTISNYGITNSDPTSNSDITVTFDSDEQLETVEASVSGAEEATLTLADGQFVETANDDGSYTYEATYTAGSDGDYTITLDTAADALGNDGSDGESDTVTLDTTSPEGSIPVPSEEVTISDPADETLQVGYEYTDEFPDLAQVQLVDANDEGVTYTWNIEDDEYVDDGTQKTVTLDLEDFDSNSEGADGSQVEDSTYTIQVVASDQVSNTNTISQNAENVRVDTTAPEFSGAGLEDPSSQSSTFSVEIDDNPADSATADDTTGVDEDSIELTLVHQRSAEENDVLLSEAGIDEDGVSWDSQSNTLTLTPGDTSEFDEYPEDGRLQFIVSAADDAGNSDTGSSDSEVNSETPSMTAETDAADDTVTVTFSDPVKAVDSDLSADDFTYEDVNDGSASAVEEVTGVTEVEDSEGILATKTVTLRLNNDVASNDLDTDLIGAREQAIQDSDDIDSYVGVAGVPLQDTTRPDAPSITASAVNIGNAESYPVTLDLGTAEPGSVDVTLTGPEGTTVSQEGVAIGASDTTVDFSTTNENTFDASALADGQVTIDVTRTDAGGNTIDSSTTVTKDTDAPSIATAEADAGTNDVYVTFDEEVGFVSEFDVTITDGDGNSIEVDDVEQEEDGVYRLELANDLTAADFDDTAASVSAGGVTDGVGNDIDNAPFDISDRSTIEFSGLEAEADSTQVTVQFDEAAFANADATGALTAEDFSYVNANDGGATAIESVDHTAGDTTATVTLDADVTNNDLGSDEITVNDGAAYDAVGNSISETSIPLGDTIRPEIGVTVERGDSDSVLEIDVDSSEQLSSLTVDVDTQSSTGAFPGVSDNSETELALEDFSATENDDGSYTYEATYDAPRDGRYGLSATGEDAAGNVGFDFESVVVDEGAPSITDASILDADGASTDIAVSFDEPVSDLSEESFEFENPTFTVGDTEADVIRTPADNVVVLQAPPNFQTGDEPEVSYESGALIESHADGESDTPEGSTVVHTTKLNLNEGQNFVSVPAASGTLEVSELESQVGSENIEVIWTYESGSWESYNPDASENDFTELEGGQGYIVTLDSGAVVDVNVNNVPTGGSAEEATPGAQSLSEGWNLVGHWQEGPQPSPVALGTLESLSRSTAIYAQDGTGYQYQTLDRGSFVPGEAYWVFVEDDEVYTEAQYGSREPVPILRAD